MRAEETSQPTSDRAIIMYCRINCIFNDIFHNINYRKHRINENLLSDLPFLKYNDVVDSLFIILHSIVNQCEYQCY